MIWFDFVTPKSVLFFKPMIDEIKARGRPVLLTARSSEGYEEITGLLDLYRFDYINRGGFGGSQLSDKLKASIDRQLSLIEFVSAYNIDRLVCLCSVDANRVAFGLGIPIINFYDIPLSDYSTDFMKALPQARLTLPLSKKAFKPFVVPNEIFTRFSLEPHQVREYNFIDPYIWLKDFVPDSSYAKQVLAPYNLDLSRPLIIVREEEYKASYVDKHYSLLYDTLEDIQKLTQANIVIIPRYESSYLINMFPFATVLQEKIIVQHLLAFADLFIGGGGTMNTEACLLGVPTISTRSFICHYDKFQIDSKLMVWVSNRDDLLAAVKTMFTHRIDDIAKQVTGRMELDIKHLVDEILNG